MIFQKKIKTYTVCIIIAWILVVLFILSIFNSKDNQAYQIPFDSNEWKVMEKTERYKMYDDLVNNYNLIGKSYSEIEMLLGTKCMEYDPNNDSSDNNYYWAYTIRNDNFEGDEVILIHFENNLVTEVEKEYLEYL